MCRVAQLKRPAGIDDRVWQLVLAERLRRRIGGWPLVILPKQSVTSVMDETCRGVHQCRHRADLRLLAEEKVMNPACVFTAAAVDDKYPAFLGGNESCRMICWLGNGRASPDDVWSSYLAPAL